MTLVINRKDQESILIGDNIHITIRLNKSNQVKLEIDAPKEMGILRHELLEIEDSIDGEISYLKTKRYFMGDY